MRTLTLFIKIAELILGAWNAIKKIRLSAAIKKAEETKNTKDAEDIINKLDP